MGQARKGEWTGRVMAKRNGVGEVRGVDWPGYGEGEWGR